KGAARQRAAPRRVSGSPARVGLRHPTAARPPRRQHWTADHDPLRRSGNAAPHRLRERGDAPPRSRDRPRERDRDPPRARRRRVARQLIVESLILAAVGAMLGFLLAEAGVRVIASHAASAVALASGLSIDWTVLVFATAVTVLAGLGFGLAPALQAARTDVVDALKAGGRASSMRRAASRLRHALVALEIVLVLPLLIGASLLAHSFARLVDVNPGFRADQVAT